MQPQNSFHDQRGNVLFYVFIAVALLGALTYAFTKDSRESYSAQVAVKLAEELFVQANMIRSAVVECTIEYPAGGGDLDLNGVIEPADNANNPFPINPSNANTPNAPAGLAAAANDNVRNLTCVGAPAARANMFQGAKNQGRFLPPAPSGFGEWTYVNDNTGVYVTLVGPNNAMAIDALTRLVNKYDTCQASLNTGTRTLTLWIHRVSCP